MQITKSSEWQIRFNDSAAGAPQAAEATSRSSDDAEGKSLHMAALSHFTHAIDRIKEEIRVCSSHQLLCPVHLTPFVGEQRSVRSVRR